MSGIPRSASTPDDVAIDAAATAALDLVAEGACVGLGSGRTAAAFIVKLGGRAQMGFRVTGVPASQAASRLALDVGIPLVSLDNSVLLDLTVDGADEVAPNLDLIKGLGGALVRERIVAAASKRQVILVASSKLVPALGTRHRIPVEVIPFAVGPVTRALTSLGVMPNLRADPAPSAPAHSTPAVSDNGNVTVDCALARPLADADAARALEAAILSIAGVVDTGLFLGTAERVIVGYPDHHVETLVRRGSSYADT